MLADFTSRKQIESYGPPTESNRPIQTDDTVIVVDITSNQVDLTASDPSFHGEAESVASIKSMRKIDPSV